MRPRRAVDERAPTGARRPGEPPVASGGVNGQDGTRARVVCACRLVTEEAVLAAIRSGADGLIELIRRSDAGTRCRGCLPDLWRLLSATREQAGNEP